MVLFIHQPIKDCPKKNMGIMFTTEVALEVNIGAQIRSTPTTPFSIEIGIGLFRFYFSITRLRYGRKL